MESNENRYERVEHYMYKNARVKLQLCDAVVALSLLESRTFTPLTRRDAFCRVLGVSNSIELPVF